MSSSADAEKSAQEDPPRHGLLTAAFVHLCRQKDKITRLSNFLTFFSEDHNYKTSAKWEGSDTNSLHLLLHQSVSKRSVEYKFESGCSRSPSAPDSLRDAAPGDVYAIFRHLVGKEFSSRDQLLTEEAVLLEEMLSDVWQVLTCSVEDDALAGRQEWDQEQVWQLGNVRARAAEAIRWIRKYLPEEPSQCPHEIQQHRFLGPVDQYLNVTGYPINSPKLIRYPRHHAFWFLVMGGYPEPNEFLRDTGLRKKLHVYAAIITLIIIQSLLPVTTLGSGEGRARNARPMIRHYFSEILKQRQKGGNVGIIRDALQEDDRDQVSRARKTIDQRFKEHLEKLGDEHNLIGKLGDQYFAYSEIGTCWFCYFSNDPRRGAHK